jgi:plastocyanin
MNYMKRVFPLLLALVAIAGLSACGGSDDSSTESAKAGGSTSTAQQPAATTIVVRSGEPVDGVQELEYSAGEQVRFTVRSDVADEIHVHGYDLMKDVTAGGSVSFSFPAELEGIFEVELEGLKEQIAELRVNP